MDTFYFCIVTNNVGPATDLSLLHDQDRFIMKSDLIVKIGTGFDIDDLVEEQKLAWNDHRIKDLLVHEIPMDIMVFSEEEILTAVKTGA
jgi:hypothetical protein